MNTRFHTHLLVASSLTFLWHPAYAQNEHTIEHIEVGASHYAILKNSGSALHQFSKEEIAQAPHIADDVFRLMPSLPGVSAGDYSAHFHVRGGQKNEVLVLLDGQQLYRPFHMKSFNSAFSIIDTENAEQVNLYTGGFSARYGNKLSGVLDIQSLQPSQKNIYSLGASFINARAAGQGSFDSQKGHWLISARRGYLDMVLKAMDDETSKFEPVYADLYSKFSYELSDRHTVSMNLLYAYDDEILDDNFDEWNGFEKYYVKEKITGSYASQYLWSRLSSQWNDTLSSQTILSVGKIDEQRRGGQSDPYEIELTVNDDKSFSFYGLKHHWQWLASDYFMLEFGLHSKQVDTHYDYKMDVHRYRVFADTPQSQRNSAKVTAEGSESGVFISNKYKLSSDWVSQLGIRYDKQNYQGFSDSQISPRAALTYNISTTDSLNFSWGHFYQAQDVLDLQISDGVTHYASAQKSTHYIVGYSGAYQSLSYRIESYYKHLSNIPKRFENVLDPLNFFPEAQADRHLIKATEGNISGLELSFEQRINKKFRWHLNYTWSKALETINGEKVKRSWDQTHTLNGGVNYAFDNGWNLNVTGHYHSGWPTTGEYGTLQTNNNAQQQIVRHLKRRNQQSLDSYLRFDLRISKQYPLHKSQLQVFFEVSNLLNRKNQCCVESSNYTLTNNNNVTVKQEHGHWLPIIPSFGVKWDF
ncbi:hypothetical protein PSECIP111854_03451 [Pseudoalteromonas sp. CIP111854]|uniref:TonB-dependent receptor plug domain-containing protein n=1 Tax=Pseudoalteromonas holothuriae TaxID=2963714 RepID=A0A9W4R1Y7_9GAMM|nr:TonB-dependent receptor plug domain-containing protein [Pseudoalteromonas sp. CIP111854]CAH9064451.1 hypothetical protein PSECIP111854_03451 [Pseudoalteromonas sp. CIP111854]